MLLLISLSIASPFALAASGVRVSGARLQPAVTTAAAARNANVCLGINIDVSCLSVTAALRADHGNRDRRMPYSSQPAGCRSFEAR
jgi:hypothetical protein